MVQIKLEWHKKGWRVLVVREWEGLDRWDEWKQVNFTMNEERRDRPVELTLIWRYTILIANKALIEYEMVYRTTTKWEMQRLACLGFEVHTKNSVKYLEDQILNG